MMPATFPAGMASTMMAVHVPQEPPGVPDDCYPAGGECGDQPPCPKGITTWLTRERPLCALDPVMTRGCCSADRAGCITRVRSVSYAAVNKYLVDAQNAQIRNGALPDQTMAPGRSYRRVGARSQTGCWSPSVR